MAYNDFRSYANVNVVAQNIVSTASAAVATSTTTGWCPINEATFLVSICAIVTATPANAVSAATYAVLSGTTTLGSVAPLQTIGSAAYSTLSKPVALTAGSGLSVICIGTGTASATETAAAIEIQMGLAPQFV